MFSDTAGAQALINYLITPEAAEVWITEGGISPNRDVNFALYPDPNTRAAAEYLANVDILRFDLSDQLPSELNLYFWSAIQDVVLAAPDPNAMEAVLAQIEAKAS